jgi:hypothetical protein
VRDDDGSRLALGDAKALASLGECPPVRELHFLANSVLLWSLDVDNVETAYNHLCKDMAKHAASRSVTSFDAMVSAIQSVLHWTADESRALALVFTFPAFLALDRVHATWDGPRTRGRPVRVDIRTRQIWKWAQAWQALTGASPGVAPNTLFAAAVAAAAPFFGFSRIGSRTLVGVSRLLRRERNKLRSPQFRWVPPLDSGAGFQHSN